MSFLLPGQLLLLSLPCPLVSHVDCEGGCMPSRFVQQAALPIQQVALGNKLFLQEMLQPGASQDSYSWLL